MAVSAALVAVSLGGCGSADYQDSEAQNCVKLVDGTVDPTDPNDDGVEVEVVDPQFCDEDGNYAQSHGGGYFFISRGGGYYASGSPGTAGSRCTRAPTGSWQVLRSGLRQGV